MLGVDYSEFENIFSNKSNRLFERYEKSKYCITGKIIIFDLDGVVFDYDTSFGNYICKELKLNYNDFDFQNKKNYSYYNFLGISRQLENSMQIKFANSNGFKTISVYPEICLLLNKLKLNGYKIIFLTARPKIGNVIDDTLFSLKSNKIEYDLLLWSKDKSDAIISLLPANIICMVEDRDKHALEVCNAGINVLLLDKSYNRDIVDTEKIKRIKNYSEIENILKLR
jgi:uncharacterized HAD superfamily protein